MTQDITKGNAWMAHVRYGIWEYGPSSIERRLDKRLLKRGERGSSPTSKNHRSSSGTQCKRILRLDCGLSRRFEMRYHGARCGGCTGSLATDHGAENGSRQHLSFGI